MHDTACGCDCPLVKSGICKSDRECPNFIESWWKEGERGEQKLVRDCAPRRILLQQAENQHTLFGVQSSICEMRDKISALIGIFANLAKKNSDESGFDETKMISHVD